ncbi:hypothetical protein [Pseudopontixanthobacter vadosimaris]|uniref:hypothetical protein n=1 Tax=Pseudopontixanthobacter vadosimaris TaxID=2726450 RepID=UPI0014743F52|nr:hypothetical protein [Pseudopontixanthobacter vadosimaris]
MESIWTVVVIAGPILLIGAVIFAYLSNKKTTAAEDARSDAGTRALREDIQHDLETRGHTDPRD